MRVRNGVFIIDEAGICINNRNWDKLDKSIIDFMKLHRHYRIDVYIFSQGEDIDISFRRLAQQWYKVVKLPLFLNKFSALVPVTVDLAIENGKWCLRYTPENSIFMWWYIPIYKTWKYFDSYATPDLPCKDFDEWGVEVHEEITFKYKLKKILYKFCYKVKNTFNKVLFRAKLRKKIFENLDDGQWYNGKKGE